MSRYVYWFDEVGTLGEANEQTTLAGGKGANLARLLSMDLPVPPGFVVTTGAYREFVAANSLQNCARGEMSDRILAGSIAAPVREQVLAAYRRLVPSQAQKVAVRSSGTAEDLASASFAGQHDTYLNVSGEEALLEAVRACWASLWSPRAIEYRAHRGWDDRTNSQLAIAVVVQVMVPAEWAGVLFTADPVSGRRDRIVLEAVRGLGEALVSGEATGIQYTLDKKSLRPVESDGKAPRAFEVPRSIIDQLASLAVRVEEGFGSPQDIEWAYAGGHCYLLQARPLTALPPTGESSETARSASTPLERQARNRFSRLQRQLAPNAIEHVPAAFYPFDFSLFFGPLPVRVFAALRSLGLSVPPGSEMFAEIVDGVVQLAPPTIRPTPRTVLLPLKLLSVLGADWADWLTETTSTLVPRALSIDEADPRLHTEEELWGQIEELQCMLLDLSIRRFIYFPHGLYATAVFGLLLRMATGKRAAALQHDLLSDIPCVTTEANRELERLARKARSSDELRRLFSEASPAQLPLRLAGSEEVRALRAEVDAYLRRYGLRETVMPSAGFPALRDDPQIVYGLLKGLVMGGESEEDSAAGRTGLHGDASNAAGARSAHETRDGTRAVAARRSLIASLSRGHFNVKRPLLSPLLRFLDRTRSFVAFREDSHFYLFLVFPVVRRLALEIGRRLAERQVLEQAEDIFLLRFEELRGQVAPADVPALVKKRKEARRAVEGRYTVLPAELLEPTDSSGELRGIGVSPGQVVGPVRVITSERDFWKLQKGDVLVARYTNPTWTPLFSVAGGVIVDAGGTASHAAIVAREYGIPGVMGTGNATTRLRDGQRVLVDGKRGLVVPIG